LNEDFKLFPNQFVNIKLYIENLKDVLIVPTSAVQHGVKGVFVYLVDKENKINIRYIMVNQNADGKTVIDDGLREGETVVTEGTDKLTDGALVSLPNDKSNNNAYSMKRK
jgi:multidrug efflux system membrane fusion protein